MSVYGPTAKFLLRRRAQRHPGTRHGQRGRPLRLLISSGPTREPIDAVRFLSNYSTGYLGRCLASEALKRGHQVTVVSGPTPYRLPRGVRVIQVEHTRQMQDALRNQLPRADALIMAAAVCDFQPVRPTAAKLARRGTLTLRLTATPDVVGTLPRRAHQCLIGFALETERVVERALAKLKAKRLDLIVAQHANGTDSPFGPRPVTACFVDPSGSVTSLGEVSKSRLARRILDEVERLWYGGARVPRHRAEVLAT